ncbi:MAG: hypothetical protein WBQ95_12745 [Terracidiphilus sp.]
MDTYSSHALEGASGVELTIALYDGIIRFMHNAMRQWSVRMSSDAALQSSEPWTS